MDVNLLSLATTWIVRRTVIVLLKKLFQETNTVTKRCLMKQLWLKKHYCKTVAIKNNTCGNSSAWRTNKNILSLRTITTAITSTTTTVIILEEMIHAHWSIWIKFFLNSLRVGVEIISQQDAFCKNNYLISESKV
jgi:hypothetical protein